MTSITPPPIPPADSDRLLDCELAMDLPLRHLIDDALNAGWEPNEVLVALKSLISNQRKAYGKDPDPADDPDWIIASAEIT